jgi:hypothetical protein
MRSTNFFASFRLCSDPECPALEHHIFEIE